MAKAGAPIIGVEKFVNFFLIIKSGVNCLFGPKRNLETLRLMKEALDR